MSVCARVTKSALLASKTRRNSQVRAGRLIAAFLVSLWATFATLAHAHESRPGYLELSEVQAGLFEVLWRRPARGDMVLSMQPVLPQHCAQQGQRARYPQPGAMVERWSVDCGEQGLVGHQVGIEGLQTTLTDVLVRITFADEITHTQVLRPNSIAFTVAGAPSKWAVSADYFRLGVEHILGGVDHLLFVLALLLIVDGTRRLIATITAFTVAHSLTLAAATLGWVHVPQAPVEAVIALSILFVAGEILHVRQGRPSITQRWPWLVAFTFGLLHGFGFAGALTEVGLPQREIPLALLMFNIGVEAGQIFFIFAVLGFLYIVKRVITAPLPWAVPVAAYGIGGLSALWVIERVSGFW
ncbi:MAG: HupE/UreJ family protein [Betaproteobacteria bacterium]|nr:MAG: HupE/UreJ family protein [Betaproteobacteria bacterium]